MWSAGRLSLIGLAALVLLSPLSACGTGDDANNDDAIDTTAVPITTVSSDSASPANQQPAGLSAELQEGTVARYLIREQFASVDLPNDAMGETSEVAGAFTFTADGDIVAEESRIVMNAASLRSDESRRDQYLSRNAIQTETYPEITFVATTMNGLEWPFPTSGEKSFTIEGDLTVREVTRPVTWEAVAAFSGNGITGTAKTSFTFGEFEMEVPDLFFLVSVDDNIRLELDFIAAW